jgi:hypothetical protein
MFQNHIMWVNVTVAGQKLRWRINKKTMPV